MNKLQHLQDHRPNRIRRFMVIAPPLHGHFQTDHGISCSLFAVRVYPRSSHKAAGGRLRFSSHILPRSGEGPDRPVVIGDRQDAIGDRVRARAEKVDAISVDRVIPDIIPLPLRSICVFVFDG